MKYSSELWYAIAYFSTNYSMCGYDLQQIFEIGNENYGIIQL